MVNQLLKEFFGPKRLYFVCGKVYQDMHYANRIVHWYTQHRLPVIPVNPKGGEIDLSVDSVSRRVAGDTRLPIARTIKEGLDNYKGKKDIDGISVSFVTPPPVTLSILKELKDVGTPVISVWFQPGSWNTECVDYATADLKIPEGNVINDCILINGHSNYVKSELVADL
ncbi:hypothetical protein KLMA_40437 [Kluyveromyces marxianus]|uniref:CoA-binding domain-containing protein n=2 Tax=Kluyveromyces marxianus TaxID=4911 RepID=W0TCD7_KLUMD|nr:hypothetical protein KLMA_40437 [Kluyveromyces marxianus DMKU3-1042]QGN16190.1 hypothetical protein FIM1_2892 [Kluyveromyces marxianus]BAO40461.1 hypothetical protein KLMA_40437 [Kluyveromyces marxianus DMKU3-1042]BAP71946.1 hypothetical protein KLMA_40437 [Kluyveromyces marxianus]